MHYSENIKPRILVAPLNWGLGHATRCIPIIRHLLANDFQPIIASDGMALEILKKEFPNLMHLELASYNIDYPKNDQLFKFHLLRKTFAIRETITIEQQQTQDFIDKFNIVGIISDNRYGVYSRNIPSVFITHQLNVLSGSTTWVSSFIHQQLMKNFNQIWVPDTKDSFLSGKLSRTHSLKIPIKFIGSLSRFKKLELPLKYDILSILSGPEPQREILENILLKEFIKYNKKVILVKGIVENEQVVQTNNSLTIYNFMTSEQLEKIINESEFVICRSGYTSIMDVASLGKKAFFIPTPGQYEQQYLAEKFQSENIAPFCQQSEFHIEKLDKSDDYSGFKKFEKSNDFKQFLSLFKGK